MSFRVRHDLPRRVREVENVFIPMPDGCRLAARLWLPEDAERAPVPALLEYIPYRKRDFMRARDEPMHHYLAGHGYACARVDLRGAGDSGGVLMDEYLPQEQADALAVIRWLAAQPWCDGGVGMTGISWGGFNALQVAALAPPELKAIITLCAADDRYADDAHYMGGCLLNENQIWGTALFAGNALPPDPAIAGEGWREAWLQRLEANRPFPAVWLAHQRRDAYWRQGSVCEDFAAIRCPVYAIGGWADGYSNAVPRLLEGLTAPSKGLIGPWAHTFPHNGVPGPAIGYLQEALRWWDHWLKGRDTGIMDEPPLRAWLQDAIPPQPFYPERPGEWVAEDTWPSPRIRTRVLYLTGDEGLVAVPRAVDTALTLHSPQTTGMAGGAWCGFGSDGEAPLDQRADDSGSLVFDSAVLEAPVAILGAPTATLQVAVDRPVALLAVRLNDVAPDGAATRVTYGLLNLTHRDGHAEPQALVPGRRYAVHVALNHIAHRFPAGHHIRLSVSTCYWPIAWPSPAPVALTLHTAGSSLALPERPPREGDAALAPFAEPEAAPTRSGHTPLQPPHYVRSIERDLVTNESIYRLYSEGGDLEHGAVMRLDDIDLDLAHTVERRFVISERDPLSARAEISEHLGMRRGAWRIRVDARTVTTADADHFRVQATLEAREAGEVVFSREWNERIPRDLL